MAESPRFGYSEAGIEQLMEAETDGMHAKDGRDSSHYIKLLHEYKLAEREGRVIDIVILSDHSLPEEPQPQPTFLDYVHQAPVSPRNIAVIPTDIQE